MKYQQVSVDFVNMVFTAITYLALAGAAWIFLRLFQACFWLPKHLKKQNDIQQMLQDKVDSYEKYILDCEEKEKAAAEAGESIEDGEETSENVKPTPIDEKKWKERRECLEMLKKELKRVRDGGDMYDWDHLLEDDENTEEGEKKDEGDSSNEVKEDEDMEKCKEVLNGKTQLNKCEKIDDITEKVEEEKKDK